MASSKTITQLAKESETLATSFEYVFHKEMFYAPVDYETKDGSVIPPPERKSWVPMQVKALRIKAREQFDTLFQEESKLKSFLFMLEQACIQMDEVKPWLLIKTTNGLRVLREDGKLYEPDGSFLPNTLAPMLNEDPADKEALFATIVEWLGGEEEEARSLLRHLATTLAPHWSAGRYVLLIGDGRNGKSVLMSMLKDLFGMDNCSSVTRQQMAKSDKIIFDLNGKLLNVVFDGPAKFLEDEGSEKSIITGEPIKVRKLYGNGGTTVETNALFIEGLNQEPKSKDKSSALQARLVRFWFPNKYSDDSEFEEYMRSERMLGALLSLLIDHYVRRSEKATMLAPTARSRQLQLDHMEDNSLALQFIVHLEETDPLGAEAVLIGTDFNNLVQMFQSWRLKLNDLTVWDRPALFALFKPVISHQRKSARVAGKPNPVKVTVITGFKQETLDLLASLREEDADDTAAVVAD